MLPEKPKVINMPFRNRMESNISFEITSPPQKDEVVSEPTEPWISPDISFSKTIIRKGTGICSPHDGAVCSVILTVHPKDLPHVEAVGCPLDCEHQFQIGQSNTEIWEIIEKCLQTMHEGEKCELSFTTGNSSKGDWQGTWKLVLFLKSFSDAEPSYKLSPEDKYTRALHHKNHALDLYREGNIEFAFKHFSRALKYAILMGLDLVLDEEFVKARQLLKCQIYCNMAACQLKFQSFTFAVANCSSALQLDPVNVKALYRRGQALAQLHAVDKAKTDFESALELEPNNATIRKALQDLFAV